jgi:ABC-type lipoprotein release transport system permease subunit
MQKFFEIARTGLTAMRLHPLRSAVTTAALLAMLTPYTAGLGISLGIQQQAEESIRFGADLYVTGKQFGRIVPVPLDVVAEIEKLDGVSAVIPRIVGSMALGKDREQVVLVGIPADRLPASTTCVEGRLYAADGLNELVVGTELARRLKLGVGSVMPPFYRSAAGERTSRVVGIFKSDVSIWQSRLVFTSFDTAAAMFNQPGRATDLLVYCRPGYQATVRGAILRMISATAEAGGATRLGVTAREDLNALLPSGLLHREGVFNLHFLLAFAVGILVILVTSGFGLAERRREIGILKATGWQTDEVLLRSMVESLLLSLTGWGLSILIAFIWLKWLNGYWIASIFLAGAGTAPAFTVPFRLTPVPALLGLLVSLVVVLSGTLYSAWRAATVPPVEAMR